MNYATGEVIKLDDKVGLGEDCGGEVVCLIDTKEQINIGEYGETYMKSPWDFLKKA